MNHIFLLEPLISEKISRQCLSECKVYWCGRDQNNDISLQGSSSLLSGKHCLFNATEKGLSILDCKSKCGTYVNGERISYDKFKNLADCDIIGISSDKTENIDPEKPYVYKLQILELQLEHSQQNGRQKRSWKTEKSAIPQKMIKTSSSTRDKDTCKKNEDKQRENKNKNRDLEYRSREKHYDNVKKRKSNNEDKSYKEYVKNYDRMKYNTTENMPSNSGVRNPPTDQAVNSVCSDPDSDTDSVIVDFQSSTINKDAAILGENNKPNLWDIKGKMELRENKFFSEISEWYLPKKSKSKSNFDADSDYDSTMSRLVLRDAISKIKDNYKSQKKKFSATLIANSIKRSIFNPDITQFNIEILLNEFKEEFPGEYCFITLKFGNDIKYPDDTKICAYTKSYTKTPFTPRSNLGDYLFNGQSYTLITYTIITYQPLPWKDENLRRLHLSLELEIVDDYLGNFVRMMRSIQFLHFSSLKNTIIQPDSNKMVFTLPEIRLRSNKLISGYNADENIRKTILRIAVGLCEADAKIFLIKVSSRNKFDVIGNIITEVLGYDNKKKRILVCTPLNDSVNEVSNRLLELNERLTNKPSMKIVRLGGCKSNNRSTVPHFIRLKEEIRLHNLANQYMKRNDSNRLIDEKIQEKIRIIKKHLECYQKTSANDRNFLSKECRNSISELSILQENRYKQVDHVKNDILLAADVITSVTTSFMTRNMEVAFGIESPNKLDVCIIEEGTYNELETLAALMFGVTKFVVIEESKDSNRHDHKAQTLFSRICKFFSSNNTPIISLID